jgi:hypothetical protein
VGYFMGYYTIWLALVKSFFVPFLGIGERGRICVPTSLRKFKTRGLRARGCGEPGESACGYRSNAGEFK